jgi:hypothetical protein
VSRITTVFNGKPFLNHSFVKESNKKDARLVSDIKCTGTRWPTLHLNFWKTLPTTKETQN